MRLTKAYFKKQGKIGGRKSAATVSPEQRAANGRLGAEKRWKGKKKKVAA